MYFILCVIRSPDSQVLWNLALSPSIYYYLCERKWLAVHHCVFGSVLLAKNYVIHKLISNTRNVMDS